MRRSLQRLLGGVAGAAAGLAVAAGASAEPAPTAPLRVLVVRGLWSREYRLEEAIARCGAMYDDVWTWDGCGSGWLGPGDQGAGGVMDFPDADALAAYGAVLVVNVPAKAFGGARKTLVDYVQNGGGVLFLGGRFALGRQFAESPYAALAPVECPGRQRWNSDLMSVERGLDVAAGADLPAGAARLDWSRKPAVFWYHEVALKPGATLWLAADGKPLLAAGPAGKGRAAVFAGSVMGEPPEGRLPFWAWDGWPALVAELIPWLSEGARTAPAGDVPEAVRKAAATALEGLESLEIEDAPRRSAELDALLLTQARRGRSAEAVAFLLQTAAALPYDVEPALAETLGAAAWPVATPGMAAPANTLVKSGQPFKTALGAAVLGAARDPGAAALLPDLYASGQPLRAAAADAAGGDVPELKPVLERDVAQQTLAIRLGALAGLGHMGDAKAIAALRKAAAEHAATGAPKPRDYADQLTDENRLYQQALVAGVRCGDADAAAPLIAALMENVYTVARARGEGNKPKDALARAHASVAAQHAWQRELLGQLTDVPAPARAALAQRIAAEKDRRITPVACAVFARRRSAPEEAALLRGSPVPAVAALATP
jgi:uncharacterized membrane protein